MSAATPQRLSPLPVVDEATTVTRLGATLVAMRPTPDGTTEVEDMADSLYLLPALPGRCTVLANNSVDGLVVAAESATEFKLLVLSPGRQQFTLPPLHVCTVPTAPLVGAISASTVAAVLPAPRTLLLRSAVVEARRPTTAGTGSDTLLPSLDGAVGAIGLVSGAAAVTIGATAIGYTGSASLRVQARQVIPLHPPGRPLRAVQPLDSAGALWGVTDSEVFVRTAETTVRVQPPAAIGSPLLAIVLILAGAIVVGPRGVWGIWTADGAARSSCGRKSVWRCEGRHGAAANALGDGVFVWSKENARAELLLTAYGFASK